MSDERLPIHIDPVRLARTGAQLQGHLPIAPMARLVAALVSSEGEAAVELEFGFDNERRAVVHVQARAEVQLACQRCLEPMGYTLNADRLLGVVINEAQAERLPSTLEPLFVTEEPLFLSDLIEDELILSLPIVPRHSDEQCALAQMPAEETDNADKSASNPFAVLAGLKTK